MNIYTEKGLERWCLLCYGLFGLFMAVVACLSLFETFVW